VTDERDSCKKEQAELQGILAAKVERISELEAQQSNK
jgi:hypothetical protein